MALVKKLTIDFADGTTQIVDIATNTHPMNPEETETIAPATSEEVETAIVEGLEGGSKDPSVLPSNAEVVIPEVVPSE